MRRISSPVVPIEIAGRLVGQQDLRLGDQRPGDGRALHFAARQLARLVLQPMRQADHLQAAPWPAPRARWRRRK